MHTIIPQKLWIGNTRDGRDAKMLFENQIRAVVDLAAEEPPAQLPRELIYFRIPLLDGGGNDPASLRLAVIAVGVHLHNGIGVLVCCGAGLSRSPTIASFAMAQWNHRLPSDCLREIQSYKPVDISPALWSELERATRRSELERATRPMNWK